MEFMRRHTIIGEAILGAAPAFFTVAKYVRSSHERFDGSGYPDGLSGSDIPLASRVVFVCDAFSAMTGQRCYRPRMTTAQARDELRRCAGSQFDPEAVQAFCDVLDSPPAVPAPVGALALR
jgi:response regulator RpfG family c-di-GMP phosphodiesterase